MLTIGDVIKEYSKGFKFKKNYYSKTHIAINPPPIVLLSSNTFMPSFLLLSEAALKVSSLS